MADLDEATVLRCAEVIHSRMRLFDAYSKQDRHGELGRERWDDRRLTAWELKDELLKLIGKRAPFASEDQGLLFGSSAGG